MNKLSKTELILGMLFVVVLCAAFGSAVDKLGVIAEQLTRIANQLSK